MNHKNYILGLSFGYHDSAVCLLLNGEIVFAAEEERFSKKKHDSGFPKLAINAALNYADISINDIDSIVYYEKPLRKFDRILTEHLEAIPTGLKRFVKSTKSWLRKKLWTGSIIKKELNYQGHIYFSDHHLSHAAYAYFTGPFEKACIVSIDGVGEDTSCVIYAAEKNKITPIKSLKYPTSIGLLYSAFTQYCGFKVNSGEYKLMGLAPYGEPCYVDLIMDSIVQINADKSISLNQRYFNYRSGESMLNSQFFKLFGYPAREEGQEISAFYKDVAASIQAVIQTLVLHIVKHAIDVSKIENLVFTGGVALNCTANSALAENLKINAHFIPPSPGDSGGAIGAALAYYYIGLNKPFSPSKASLKRDVYLGTEHIIDSDVLDQFNLNYLHLDENALIQELVNALDDKQVLGVYRERMEFGPRSLGNRSIIASPKFPDMQAHLNKMVKKRELFRPFAPITTDLHAQKWFDIKHDTPFMTHTHKCLQSELIPSCAHVDDSSRTQVLSETDNAFLFKLINVYGEESGIPVLINTSFNLRGLPIVESPLDALNTFFNCDIDVLILDNFLITKRDNGHLQNTFELPHYELD